MHRHCHRYTSGCPKHLVIAGEHAITRGRFGTSEMRGIQSPQTGRREGMRPRSDDGRNGNMYDGTVCPPRNFDTPVHERMLSILKREYIRPYQVVNAMSNALKDSEYRRSLLRNPCLVLIIKRPIETVEIEIEKHGEPYLCLLFYCRRTLKLTCRRKRERGMRGRWRRSGAVLCLARSR